jgi:hypothetical protein
MEFYCVNGVWQDGGGRELPTFPIQKDLGKSKVPLCVAEEAYKEYSARYGKSQSLERLGERGGFGVSEIAILLYDRCKRLEQAESRSSKCAKCRGSGEVRGPSDSGYMDCPACNGKGW